MTAPADDLRRRAFRAIAAMEFGFGWRPWRAVLPGLRAWLLPLAWVAIAALLRRSIVGAESRLTDAEGLALVLLLLGGTALCVMSPVWSWASTEPVGRPPDCGPHLGHLLPIRRRDRDLAAGIARLRAMLVGCALGLAMLLGAWVLSRQGTVVRLSLRPLLAWALALGPAFAIGRVYQWASRELVHRFSARSAGQLLGVLCAVAYLCWWCLFLLVHGVWQATSAFGGACLALALCRAAFARGRAGATVLQWIESVRAISAPPRRPTETETALPAEAPSASAAPRPSRLSLEMGWALCPELGWPAWSRSAAVIFTVFAIVGLLTAVGWPVLVFALAALRGHMPASLTAQLAWGPYAVLALLPGAGVGFSVAVCGIDFASSRRRYARALLPIAPRALWRARLEAALIYSIGFCLLAEACDLLGQSVIALMTHYWPQLPPERHLVALAMPALSLMAWAQGPLMRVPLRLFQGTLETWGVLVIIAFLGMGPPVTDMVEAHRLAVLAAMAWALALLFVLLSRLTIAPNSWPVKPDGRLTPLAQVAAGLALIASFPTSGFVLATVLFAGMMLLPP